MCLPSSAPPQGMASWQPALHPGGAPQLCFHSGPVWHVGTLLPGESPRSARALEHQRDALQDLRARFGSSWVLLPREGGVGLSCMSLVS